MHIHRTNSFASCEEVAHDTRQGPPRDCTEEPKTILPQRIKGENGQVAPFRANLNLYRFNRGKAWDRSRGPKSPKSHKLELRGVSLERQDILKSESTSTVVLDMVLSLLLTLSSSCFDF